VARSRWRERVWLLSVVVLGSAAGIAVGALLVHVIIGRWGKI
jgi:hypothetical protein